MEKLTRRQEAVLEVIDDQITELEEKLKKAQPMLNELERLRSTRRALLSERGVTSGGNGRKRLSMEEVIHYLDEHGPSMPEEIADALGFPPSTVRSHLTRHKGIRYIRVKDGWDLTEAEED